jgi:hypothetical protein
VRTFRWLGIGYFLAEGTAVGDGPYRWLTDSIQQGTTQQWPFLELLDIDPAARGR